VIISFLNKNKLEFIDFLIDNLEKYCKINSEEEITFSNLVSKDINVYVVHKKNGSSVREIIKYCTKNKVKIENVLIANFDGQKSNNIETLFEIKKYFKNVFTIRKRDVKSGNLLIEKPYCFYSIDVEEMFKTLTQK
jgi:cellulose biosynthesis protein BcsQ